MSGGGGHGEGCLKEYFLVSVLLYIRYAVKISVYVCVIFFFFSSMEDSPFGPLTQRLVSAFLEENLMTPMDDIITDLGGK